MTQEPRSFPELVSLWPNVGSLASEIEVKEVTARQWKLRQSIPGEYWASIVSAASKRASAGEEKFSVVTLDLLAHLAANAAAQRADAA